MSFQHMLYFQNRQCSGKIYVNCSGFDGKVWLHEPDRQAQTKVISVNWPFRDNCGTDRIYEHWTSRGDKTQCLPTIWCQKQSPFHYDVIPKSYLCPQNVSPAVILKGSISMLSADDIRMCLADLQKMPATCYHIIILFQRDNIYIHCTKMDPYM